MNEVRKKGGSASNYLLFFFLIPIVAGAFLFLLPVYRDYQKKQIELNRLKEELNTRKEESARLNAEVVGLRQSPEVVEKVAREKFGLVKEGETVVRYEPAAKDQAPAAGE